MPTDPYIGEVTMFAGNFAPRGWAFCDGQLLPISQYNALFSILGTIYGGDGRTTFALPDLRGRMPMGPGSGPGLTPRREGQKGGSETHTLGIPEMPNHGHSPTLYVESALGTTNAPPGRMIGVPSGDTKLFADVAPADEVALAADSIKEANVGGNQAFDKMNPFLSIHFIIALEGVYPSRS